MFLQIKVKPFVSPVLSFLSFFVTKLSEMFSSTEEWINYYECPLRAHVFPNKNKYFKDYSQSIYTLKEYSVEINGTTLEIKTISI